jgi:hypothetical protein
MAAISGPGGTFNLGTGAAVAEEGITIEMIEDKTTMVIGADGAVMHSLHAGQGARANIRLLKTSPTNALLSALYALQTSSSALHGQNVLTVNDTARGDNITLQNAAFARFPVVSYAKDGPMYEWPFIGTVDSIIGSGALIA